MIDFNFALTITSMSVTIDDSHNKRTFEIENGSDITMYVCGPTVYTHSHVGHLKTYMTFDIIRRILTKYFRVNLRYMMNITNIDDKIIQATYEAEYGDDVDLDILSSHSYLPEHKFTEYADFWENEFFRTMRSVNIQDPDILSRVTEYIDEILELVSTIDKNGYAFVNDGSVYFYGTKYHNIKDGDEQDYSRDPNNAHNFALLKKARPHEPSWESKWGAVRPGWHIECSAMASSVFGTRIDIHGGGIDLAFPHHTNEVLQSDAAFHTGTDITWVRNFMHTGHLNIKGLKMSRSLKNFITIDEILKEHDADSLRMLFLLHSWCTPMDYSDNTMSEATHFIDFFNNFNKQIRSVLMRQNVREHKKHGSNESKLFDAIRLARSKTDESLKNNLDTPGVIKTLQTLITSVYSYIETIDAEFGHYDGELVRRAHEFVVDTLSMFGLAMFDKAQSGKEEDLVKIISDVRTDLRGLAREVMDAVRSGATTKTVAATATRGLFQMTDDIRDVKLPTIGIELTDQ